MESVAVVLGRRIRRLRERKGLTQTQLATLILSNKTTISDIERGHQIPSAVQVDKLEAALDADGVLQELYDLLNIGVQESAIVADAEQGALAQTAWESRVIPGLLQTEDYMRAAMSTSVPPARLDREVSIRLSRQKILKSLVSGWFVISEAVLHLAYGGKDTMRGQLAHLEAVATMPNIGIQVMPFTSTQHPGGDGPLVVIEYQGKPGIWFTEGPRSGRMSDDRQEVLSAMHALNMIRAAALPVHESIEYIRSIRENKYEQ